LILFVIHAGQTADLLIAHELKSDLKIVIN